MISTDGHVHDDEAEMALLGAILVDDDVIDAVADLVVAREFYAEAHRTIFEAMVRIRKDSADVDASSLASELQRVNRWDVCGGAAYLDQLIDKCPVVAHPQEYARRIAVCAQRNRVADRAHRLEVLAREPSATDEDLEKAIRAVRDEAEGGTDELPYVTACDLDRREWSDRTKWLIHGVWLDVGCGLVCGPPKSSKSILTLLAAGSVATGEPFLWKYPVARPGPVVYINEEDGLRQVQERLRKLSVSQGIDYRTPNLRIFCQTGCNLTTQRGRARFVATVRSAKPVLVVIDCLRRIAPGVNENDSREVSEILHFLRRVSVEHSTAIMLVHHFKVRDQYNKGAHATSMIRGSSDFEAWYDSFWGSERVKKGQPKHHFCADHRSAGEIEPMELSIAWDDEKGTVHIVVGETVKASKKQQELDDQAF